MTTNHSSCRDDARRYDDYQHYLDQRHQQALDDQAAAAELQDYINEHGDYPPDVYAVPASVSGDGPRLLRHERVFTITQQAIDALHDPANAPILIHDAAMLAIEQDDPYLTQVQAAVNRWQLLRDSAYRAYARQVGVPVAPARFHDLVEQLADAYRGPHFDHARAAAITAALGLL